MNVEEKVKRILSRKYLISYSYVIIGIILIFITLCPFDCVKCFYIIEHKWSIFFLIAGLMYLLSHKLNREQIKEYKDSIVLGKFNYQFIENYTIIRIAKLFGFVYFFIGFVGTAVDISLFKKIIFILFFITLNKFLNLLTNTTKVHKILSIRFEN